GHNKNSSGAARVWSGKCANHTEKVFFSLCHQLCRRLVWIRDRLAKHSNFVTRNCAFTTKKRERNKTSALMGVGYHIRGFNQMDKLIEAIAQKCIRENLIDEDQAEWLQYSLQCKVMNIGGFCILIALGSLVAPFPQVLLLNLGLVFLRKKTNGLHMPTKLSCFAFSLACEYVCLLTICQLASDKSLVSLGLLLISS